MRLLRRDLTVVVTELGFPGVYRIEVNPYQRSTENVKNLFILQKRRGNPVLRIGHKVRTNVHTGLLTTRVGSPDDPSEGVAVF